MNLKSAFARIAFVFLLLVGQQQAAVHAISHVSSQAAGNPSKQQLPAELQCEQCLSFASIGSALTDAHAVPVFGAVGATLAPALPAVAVLPAPLRAFNSRAPPVLS